MAGLREQKKAETRQAIIAAAVRLFSTKGFDNTSIEDIARQAGIGKATVYTYFSAKSDIFLTYCDDELDEAFVSLKSQERCELHILNQLVEFFMLMFRFLTRNREFGRQLMREMSFPKELNEKAIEHDRRYFEFLQELLKAAQGRNEIAGGQDLFLVAGHFFSLYFGVLAGWYSGYVHTDEEVERMLRNLFQQAIDGVGK